MKSGFTKRFGFLVRDVDRLFGEQFDRLSRERIGLSRAQVRLLGELAMHDEALPPLSQIELARRLDLSAMSVGGMCDRLVLTGWIQRQPSTADRRANEVRLAPKAIKALEEALRIGDTLSAQMLSVLSAQERHALISLLDRVRMHQLELAGRDDAGMVAR